MTSKYPLIVLLIATMSAAGPAWAGGKHGHRHGSHFKHRHWVPKHSHRLPSPLPHLHGGLPVPPPPRLLLPPPPPLPLPRLPMP